jgi:hypothetical protein
MQGRTMNLGCGTSEMGADLVRDGYEHVVNVDIDEKHIESMRARHGECREPWMKGIAPWRERNPTGKSRPREANFSSMATKMLA